MGGAQSPTQNTTEIGRYLFSSKSPMPNVAYQAMQLLPPDSLTSAQADFVSAGGNPSLTPDNLRIQVTGGNGGVNSVMSIVVDEANKAADRYGLTGDQKSEFAALAIATAEQESGLNPNAVGDSGHSVGLFQLHDQGEGAGMGDTRYDPRTNAAKALDVMAQTFAANPNASPGQIAAMAQRPADQAGYANTVDQIYAGIRGGKLPTQSSSPLKLAGPEYTQAANIYGKYFGKTADTSTLEGIVAGGRDVQQMEDYVRSLPSHISGMTMGQYTDLRAEANAASQKLFGHEATDGMVAEMFNTNQTNPTQVERFMNFINPKLDPQTYNAIYSAAQPYLRNVWNESGFDPRIAANIAAAGGVTPQTNTQSSSVADSLPVAPSDQGGQMADNAPNTGTGPPDATQVPAPIQQTQPQDQTPGGGSGNFTA
jgi:hypothetical protein